MVKRKFKWGRFLVSIVILLLVCALIIGGVFFYLLTPISNDKKEDVYEVTSGMTVNQIFEDLEEKNIIRSATVLKIYSKLKGGINVSAGIYEINSSMYATDIYETLKNGGKSSRETVNIVFKEGRNVRELISILEKETSIKESDVIDKLSDKAYLNGLTLKYWFLTDEILDKDIYYSLEGYLFPNTYTIYKDASASEVIEKMLDETLKVLNKYKSEIESSKYSVHEIMTLASIVELESVSDREKVAGVFYNRLNSKMGLGSDVTTYYAFKLEFHERDLKQSEIYDCTTKYNTRCQEFIGLPVGPVGNPGEESIKATLEPEIHDYYYFIADKNMNTYFFKTYEEHRRKGIELSESGQLFYD